MKHGQTFVKALIVLFISATFFTACSDSDDTPTINVPVVTYADTNLNVIFFNAGSSSVPTVNWGGNEGAFALATTVAGLSIDETTGTISWTKDLPIGTHNVDVVATNSAGPTTVELTINNPFQGSFSGTFSYTSSSDLYDFDILFNSDNTAVITQYDSAGSSYDSDGTWTMSGSTINIDYTSSQSMNDFSFSGMLTTGTVAEYNGEWFFEHGSEAGNEGGTFGVTLQ